jgi:hypothetical protein
LEVPLNFLLLLRLKKKHLLDATLDFLHIACCRATYEEKDDVDRRASI